MTEKTFTTTKGQKIPIEPISDTLITKALAAMEKQWRARGEPLDPPTYTVQIAGGAATETYPHDDKTVENDPEAKEKLLAYRDARERLDAAQEEKRMRLLLSGLVFDIPETGWVQKHQRLGVEIPDKEADPEGYWFHYLTTEVLITPDDLLRAIELVTKLSYAGAVDEDAISAAMDNFRRSLQQNSTKELANRTGAVDAQPQNGGG